MTKQEEKKIISFEDLVFYPHPNGFADTQAKIILDDNIIASVIQGGGAYSTHGTYELGISVDGGEWVVEGHLTPEDVTDRLKRLQQ
jgi:hypothetical protein